MALCDALLICLALSRSGSHDPNHLSCDWLAGLQTCNRMLHRAPLRTMQVHAGVHGATSQAKHIDEDLAVKCAKFDAECAIQSVENEMAMSAVLGPHGNVVRIIDVMMNEQDAPAGPRILAMVMPYYKGRVLPRHRRSVPLSMYWVAHLEKDICTGVGHIHAAGVVHDLKEVHISWIAQGGRSSVTLASPDV